MEQLKTGLVLANEDDLKEQEVLLQSASSITDYWLKPDNSSRYLTWDSALEDYLKHRSKILEKDGREKYLAWNAFKEVKHNWLVYDFNQAFGNCCGCGHRNSFKASQLTYCLKMGLPAEGIAHNMTYAIARGNGSIRMGDGLNLVPMAKWSAQIGNFLDKDFNTRKVADYNYCRKPTSAESETALKNQSVIVQITDKDSSIAWEKVLLLCKAGYGINTGSGIYPGACSKDDNGVSTVSRWSSGGHATAYHGYKEVNGTQYVFFENSHGARYACEENKFGCWCKKEHVMKHYRTEYGYWYGNLAELNLQ